MAESSEATAHRERLLSSMPLMRVVDLRHALRQFGISPSPKLRKAELSEMLKRAIKYQPLLNPNFEASSLSEFDRTDLLDKGDIADQEASCQNSVGAVDRSIDKSARTRCRSFLISIEEEVEVESQRHIDSQTNGTMPASTPSSTFRSRMHSWSQEVDLPVTVAEWSAENLDYKATADAADDWDLSTLKAELHRAASSQQAGGDISRGPIVEPAQSDGSGDLVRPRKPAIRPRTGVSEAQGLEDSEAEDLTEEEDKDEDDDDVEWEGVGESLTEARLQELVSRTDPASLLGGVVRAMLPAALHDLRPRPAAPARASPAHGRPFDRVAWQPRGRPAGGRWSGS